MALLSIGFSHCSYESDEIKELEIHPVFVTEQTPNDTDDPAIWYNKENPAGSLVLGTDKGDTTGGIFVFNLEGKLLKEKSIYNLHRPNNIDIAYDFLMNNKKIDIAVFSERGKNRIRVISLPDCRFIDNGGIEVFKNDSFREPMGIALYTDKCSNIYAIVGRKNGPSNGYLHQYLLVSINSHVDGHLIRTFGEFSGLKEIEAIAVDKQCGYVYYSDENFGIRKYFADPHKGNQELSVFGSSGFTQDQEGISIYNSSMKNGYIIVSDQEVNKFRLFDRNGGKEHEHKLKRIVSAQTNNSDGNDLLNRNLGPLFPKGIFVAMSDNRTFHFYNLEDLVRK